MIDGIISEHADDLRAALVKEFQKSPVKFWQRFGFPLVPQALVAKVESDAPVLRWRSLLDADRANRQTQDEIRTLRDEYPGHDSQILELLGDGVPLAAIRTQLGRPRCNGAEA